MPLAALTPETAQQLEVLLPELMSELESLDRAHRKVRTLRETLGTILTATGLETYTPEDDGSGRTPEELKEDAQLVFSNLTRMIRARRGGTGQ